MQESMIAVLPRSGDEGSTNRCIVTLSRPGRSSVVVSIKQQSWGSGVGWYTQSSVQLSAEQARMLLQALGKADCMGKIEPAPEVLEDGPVILPFPGSKSR